MDHGYAQKLPKVRLVSKNLTSVMHDPDEPLPPEWAWADKAVAKFRDEAHPMVIRPELLQYFLKDNGEIVIVEGKRDNTFFDFAGVDYFNYGESVAFAARYRSQGDKTPHSAVVFLADHYVERGGTPFPEPGYKFIMAGNILVHELGHCGDFRSDLANSGFKIPAGRHSLGGMFALCTKLDRLLNGEESFVSFVRNNLDPHYDEDEARKMKEIFAIAMENFYANNQHQLPPLLEAYIRGAFLPDMALKAQGKTQIRAFLEMAFDRVSYKGIFGDELGNSVRIWAQSAETDEGKAAEAIILANRDIVVAKLTAYLGNMLQTAQSKAEEMSKPLGRRR